jgi:hypothetical protein
MTEDGAELVCNTGQRLLCGRRRKQRFIDKIFGDKDSKIQAEVRLQGRNGRLIKHTGQLETEGALKLFDRRRRNIAVFAIGNNATIHRLETIEAARDQTQLQQMNCGAT